MELKWRETGEEMMLKKDKSLGGWELMHEQRPFLFLTVSVSQGAKAISTMQEHTWVPLKLWGDLWV